MVSLTSVRVVSFTGFRSEIFTGVRSCLFHWCQKWTVLKESLFVLSVSKVSIVKFLGPTHSFSQIKSYAKNPALILLGSLLAFDSGGRSNELLAFGQTHGQVDRCLPSGESPLV